MRTALLTFIALASLSLGCTRGSPRLEGHWRGVGVEGVTPEQQNAALGFAREMDLDFRGDVITMTAGQDRQQGRYAVEQEDKTVLVISTDRDGKAEKQTFTFLNERMMKWTVFDGRGTTITFARQ